MAAPPTQEGSIYLDRPLTDEERELTRWILENGESEGIEFLDQLERARVVGVCTCGCATIDFVVEGLLGAPPGVHILGDFIYGSEANSAGVFVFSSGGILSGLEVYGRSGDAPKVLPKPSELRRFGNS
jgi:hypothetical protein